jgi:hypothetical protein
MAQVNGIVVWTEGIKAELAKRLPKQRKTQRDKRDYQEFRARRGG